MDNNCAAVSFPDFTRGHWNDVKGYKHAYAPAADEAAAEAKAKQTVIEIKEVKFRPGTDDGDYNIKLRNIRRFLADGDKCKITLRFRGREITHQQLGLNLLNRLRDDLADSIQVEQFPKLEGRQMIMMISPARAMKKPAGAAKPQADGASAAPEAADKA